MSDEDRSYSGEDLVAWFREVTEEIDGTPARLVSLALRRRELARGLIQVYGVEVAAERVGVSGRTLAALNWSIPASMREAS